MSEKKIRYAVVGLGHISQAALLPSFINAAQNSELSALVSGTPEKLEKLSARYGVKHTYNYQQFEQCLSSGQVDAIYIGLPNHMHRDFTLRAAEQGVHVLCEKPLANNAKECLDMIEACRANKVKLMTAYRLHLEEANLTAIEMVQSGRIGEPRYFNALFSFQIADGNVRLKHEFGGGSLLDLGVYCLNAMRYLFRDEPLEVSAFNATGEDPRFDDVEEMTTAILRFPGERLASFTTSFAAAPTLHYHIVGSEGALRLDPAFNYTGAMRYTLQTGGKTEEGTINPGDHFGAQLEYFSRCILEDIEPVPDGEEGLADVRIIDALYQSASTGTTIKLPEFVRAARPDKKLLISKPPVAEPELVCVESPGRKG